MAYEEREVVADEPVATDRVVERERVVDDPAPVVERRTPTTQYVQNDDPVGNVVAASHLIQTIVWSVVVLVLLAVGLLALHTYAHLF